MIDLHVHSTFSDGSETPEQLVARARKIGLHALALTDHDNLRGVPSFFAACRAQRMAGISGVEISVEVPRGTLHILGLGVDPAHEELNAKLGLVLDGREWRNHRILERLRDLGMPLEWDEVTACAGEDVVGRPHFAQALIRRGIVAGRQEAFDRFLSKGRPAYVDRFRLSPQEGIRLIRAAGGLPVLAHPFSWEPDQAALASKVEELRTAGLGGLEAYYSDHLPDQTIACLRLAERFGLAVSGGSDYHGNGKDGISLGTGRGGLSVPDHLFASLLSHVATQAGIA